MKDRVPTYPGRVKLMPVEGQENTYDMTRADQPTQAGTPLNKATLLKDETAEKLGLDPADDPTVDDALNGLAVRDVKNNFKVGDTLSTLRTDLGDNWLLCNGEELSAENYPELGDVIQPAVPYNFNSIGDFHYQVRSWVYAEGNYVALFKQDAAPNLPVLIYSPELDGIKTQIELFKNFKDDGTYNDITPGEIIYENGYYVVSARGNKLSSPYKSDVLIAYTTNLTGTWNYKVIWSGTGTSSNVKAEPHKLKFLNNQFVLAGVSGTSSLLYWTIAYSDSPGGTWTIEKGTRNDEIMLISDIEYLKNKYYILAKFAGNSVIMFIDSLADFPTATNSSNTYEEAALSGGGIIGQIYYDEASDKFFLFGVNYDTANQVVYVVSESDFINKRLSSWNRGGTNSSVIGLTALGMSATSRHTMARWEDYFILPSGKGIKVFSISDILSTAILSSPTAIPETGANRQFDTNYNTYLVDVLNNNFVISPAYGAFWQVPVLPLPTISIDGVYTYIRAKE